MIGTQFTYEAPDTLKGVLDLIGRDGYQVLTADQSLVNAMRKGGMTLNSLVSLRKVPGLASIRHEAGQLHIGASTTYANLLQSENIGSYPVLVQALATIQDPHLRHNCTLGGALHYGGNVHAPVLAALMALDASAIMLSRTDDMRLPIQSFSQQGQRVPFLQGRLLTIVQIPANHLTTGCYLALDQLSGRNPAKGIAVTLGHSERGVDDVRVVLAGFTEQPIRLNVVETALVGNPLSPERIAEAIAKINETTLPVSTDQTSAGYSLHIAKVLVKKALTQLMG